MIFVDTGAWIALLNQRDQYHHDAVVVFNKLQLHRMRLLTTDYVIDETVTRFRYDTNHTLTVEFLNRIELLEETEFLTIAEIDKNVFEAVKSLFRQYDSVQLSFTDCTSFVICRVHKISEAFAFDHHFPIMGIIVDFRIIFTLSGVGGNSDSRLYSVYCRRELRFPTIFCVM